MNDGEWTTKMVARYFSSATPPTDAHLQGLANAVNAALAANDEKWRERFRKFEKVEQKFGPVNRNYGN